MVRFLGGVRRSGGSGPTPRKVGPGTEYTTLRAGHSQLRDDEKRIKSYKGKGKELNRRMAVSMPYPAYTPSFSLFLSRVEEAR